MADVKIRDLPALVTPDLNILFEVEVPDEPTEALKSKKATVQQVVVDNLNASAMLNAGSLEAQAVTFAKQQDVSSQTFVGRNTAGPGNQEELSKATALSILNVEDGADVTDETNVVASLDGATIPTTTGAGDDKVLIQDTDDSNNLKTVTISSLGGSSIGKHTIWIPAEQILPSITAGCAGLLTDEILAGRPDITTLDFSPTTQEFAQFSFPFRKAWNLGDISFRVYWICNGTNPALAVRWGLQALARSTDERPGDVAFAGGQFVNSLCLGSLGGELIITNEITGLTITNTPIDFDLIFFRIQRDAANAADTVTGDAKLLGVQVLFTTDAANDN